MGKLIENLGNLIYEYIYILIQIVKYGECKKESTETQGTIARASIAGEQIKRQQNN